MRKLWGSNRFRTAAAFAVVALVAYLVPTLLVVSNVERQEAARYGGMLQATLQLREQALRSAVNSIGDDLRILGSNALALKALDDFSKAFHDLGADPGGELRRLYVTGNPHPADARSELVKAADGSRYSEVHASYHQWFRSVVAARDYYDLFLADAKGDIVYTVHKETDLGTNLIAGPRKDQPISAVFRKALEGAPQSMIASGFAAYGPSGDIPAAFVATALVSEGRSVGALILQLRIDPFDAIMRGAATSGDMPETYLVNAEGLLLSRPRSAKDGLLKRKIDTPSVAKALAGASGVGVIADFRGVPVLSAFQPFNWAGGRWALVAEADLSEVHRNSATLIPTLIIAGLAVLALAALLGWILAARE